MKGMRASSTLLTQRTMNLAQNWEIHRKSFHKPASLIRIIYKDNKSCCLVERMNVE